MAFASDIRGFEASIVERASSGLKSIVARVAQYRLYRKTLDELGALSVRELDDLGLNRSMIKRIALEAAYDL